MMRNSEHEELEKQRTKEIDQLFESVKKHIASPTALFQQAAFESERIRLINIVNSKYGAELYDSHFLSLEEMQTVKTVEAVRKLVDTYLDIVNYYEENYANLKWIIKNKNYVTQRLSTGNLKNWEELLQHKDVKMKRLSVEASTTLLIDVLSRMPETPHKEEILASDDGAKIQAANGSEELHDIKKQEESSPPQTVEVSIFESDGGVKDHILNTDMKKTDEIHNNKLSQEILLSVHPTVDNSKGEKNAAIATVETQIEARKNLDEKETKEKQLALECYKQKLNDLFTILFRCIHQYTFWSNQVSKTGTAPEVSWVKDEKGKPIKVPLGIYKMLLIFRRPSSHSMSFDLFIKSLMEIADISVDRLSEVGLFSTRRSLTNGFYDSCTKIRNCLNENMSFVERGKKIDLIIAELEKLNIIEESPKKITKKIIFN